MTELSGLEVEAEVTDHKPDDLDELDRMPGVSNWVQIKLKEHQPFLQCSRLKCSHLKISRLEGTCIRHEENLPLLRPYEIDEDDGEYGYQGQWRFGERHGRGILIKMDGNIMYEGYWDEGQKKFGREIVDHSHVYEGDWENDQWHGGGKVVYENGGEYEGEF